MVSNWWMLVDVDSKICWSSLISSRILLPKTAYFWGVTKSGPHQAMASHALLWPPNSAGFFEASEAKVLVRASEVISLLNSGMLTSWKVVSVPCQVRLVGLFCGPTVLGLAFDKRPRTGGDRGVGWMVPDFWNQHPSDPIGSHWIPLATGNIQMRNIEKHVCFWCTQKIPKNKHILHVESHW